MNRTVWLLWLQGWDQAPWLVRQAARSWEVQNPDWRVVRLSRDSLGEWIDDVGFIDDPAKTIGPQAQSDVIRLSLLARHGGVWADATMLCMQPLDPWIHEAAEPAGIWMYHGSGNGMTSRNAPAIWFIAAERDAPMIAKWKAASDAFWRENDATAEYFLLDHLFRRTFESDPEFRRLWRRCPHLRSGAPGQAHMLAGRGRMIASDDEARRILRERPPYALKLSWKRWQDAFPDLDAPACRASNGRYAIEMSERRVIWRHAMRDKSTLGFRADMTLLETRRKLGRLRRRVRRWAAPAG